MMLPKWSCFRVVSLALSAGLISPGFAQSATRPAADIGRDPCRAVLPGAPSPFTEEAAARGISYHIGDPDTGFATLAMGAASFADLDRDGDADIICVGDWNGLVTLYENDGTGHFTPHAAPDVLKATCAIAADYDGDKDNDIFIATWEGPDVLLRNDGGFVFTDVSAQAGITGVFGSGGGCAWADVNGDDLLDLYVANRTGTPYSDGSGNLTPDPNRLFINQGDGTFVDMAPALGLTHGDEPTLLGVFVDFDLDGDPDLYEGNDKGSFCIERSNYLFENVGGTFVDITAASGTESCTDTMGIGIGDFDMNGWPDLYNTHTPNAPGNTLLLNNGDGTFTQDAAAFGVDNLALSWGCLFFDHDNDGDLAIYVCDTFEPDHLFDYDGTPPATEIGAQMGVHSDGRSYNVAAADIDLDGDLDLLIERIPGDIELYINHEGEKRHWISLEILYRGGNQYAIGALVSVRTGDRTQIAQVVAGGNSYRTQNELARHFGLGDACVADEITVTWPDGSTRTLHNYPADARYAILPLANLGDGNGDGAITIEDIRGLADAIGRVRPGTEVYDMDGDADIDLADLMLLIRKAGG